MPLAHTRMACTKRYYTSETLNNTVSLFCVVYRTECLSLCLFAGIAMIASLIIGSSLAVQQEIIPFNGSTAENGIKGDTTIEKLGKLSPAFVKPHGTHTAANSSFLSDGASAALITSEKAAKQMGLTPRSTFKVVTELTQAPACTIALNDSLRLPHA